MYPYIYFALPSYSVLAFIGGFFALLYTYFRTNKFGVQFTSFIKIFIISMIGGFVGGKALYIVTKIPTLIMNFSFNNMIHLITHSGIVFYGGLFGVLTALKIYIKYSDYEESAIYSLVAPAIPLFHGFGRIGCFLAGCCYGKELGTSFGLFNVIYVSRIPVQLIESIFEFSLFFIIIFIGRKHKELNLLKIYLLSYAVFRFINEFFRADEVNITVVKLRIYDNDTT